MGPVTADSVAGHDGADDEAEGTEDEEGDCEAYLLVGRPVLDDIGGFHHDILVRDGEGVVDVRHGKRRPRGWTEYERTEVAKKWKKPNWLPLLFVQFSLYLLPQGFARVGNWNRDEEARWVAERVRMKQGKKDEDICSSCQ